MGIPPQIPKEVLSEIVSYLDSDFTFCPLRDAALSALYGHVDLQTFLGLENEYSDEMEDADEEPLEDESVTDLEYEEPVGQDLISLKRQKHLIASLGA